MEIVWVKVWRWERVWGRDKYGGIDKEGNLRDRYIYIYRLEKKREMVVRYREKEKLVILRNRDRKWEVYRERLRSGRKGGGGVKEGNRKK